MIACSDFKHESYTLGRGTQSILGFDTCIAQRMFEMAISESPCHLLKRSYAKAMHHQVAEGHLLLVQRWRSVLPCCAGAGSHIFKLQEEVPEAIPMCLQVTHTPMFARTCVLCVVLQQRLAHWRVPAAQQYPQLCPAYSPLLSKAEFCVGLQLHPCELPATQHHMQLTHSAVISCSWQVLQHVQ